MKKHALILSCCIILITSCKEKRKTSFYCAEVPETDSLWQNFLSYNIPDSIKGGFSFEDFVEEKDSAYYWKNGDTIRVWFLSGSNEAKIKVLNIANLWSKYANIFFAPAISGVKAHIRVSFQTNGYWAYVGTRGMQYYTSVSLDNLDKETDEIIFQSVVLHEFGHVLGLLHEHQSPAGNIRWNKQAVYQYYAKPPNEWKPEYVDENVFKKFEKSQTNYSRYDPLSIMHYPVPEYLTEDNTEVPFNYTLSETDILYIKRKYPKN
jgi:serralysin